MRVVFRDIRYSRAGGLGTSARVRWRGDSYGRQTNGRQSYIFDTHSLLQHARTNKSVGVVRDVVGMYQRNVQEVSEPTSRVLKAITLSALRPHLHSLLYPHPHSHPLPLPLPPVPPRSDNLLVHAGPGRKRVVLYAPTDAPCLYVASSSSAVVDIGTRALLLLFQIQS
jgi:hypothetical protein